MASCSWGKSPSEPISSSTCSASTLQRAQPDSKEFKRAEGITDSSLILSFPRLCRNVTKWHVSDDKRLIRCFSYIDTIGALSLFAELRPSDLKSLVIRLYVDSDWAGDPDTCKSTSGLWIDLWHPESGRRWQVSWNSRAQSHSASSTAEAEVVAFAHGLDAGLAKAYEPETVISMSAGLRQEGIPIQSLMEALLGVRLPLKVHVDNDQCIAAVRKGFSKKLRQIARTHRISLDVCHDLVEDKELKIDVGYVPTKEQLADTFTKALIPLEFARARESIGLRKA